MGTLIFPAILWDGYFDKKGHNKLGRVPNRLNKSAEQYHKTRKNITEVLLQFFYSLQKQPSFTSSQRLKPWNEAQSHVQTELEYNFAMHVVCGWNIVYKPKTDM